jgi:hypothetical protein
VHIGGVQAAYDISEHDANTYRAEYTTTGMSHTEGGWPKEVDISEAGSAARYRKKVGGQFHSFPVQRAPMLNSTPTPCHGRAST